MEEKEAERERERGRVRDSGTGKRPVGTGARADGVVHRPQHTQSDTDYPFTTSTSTSRSTTITSVTARVFSNAVLTANLAFRAHSSSPRPGPPSAPAAQATPSSAPCRSTLRPPRPPPLPQQTQTTRCPLTCLRIRRQSRRQHPRRRNTWSPRGHARTRRRSPGCQRWCWRSGLLLLPPKLRQSGRGSGGSGRDGRGKRLWGRTRTTRDGENCTQGSASSRGGLSSSSLYSLPVCASSDLTIVSPSEVPKTPPPRHRRRHALTPSSKCIIEGSGGGGSSALFPPIPRKLSGLFDLP